MFKNLTLRTKLVAIVVPPLVVLAVIAAYGVLLGFRGADSLDQLAGDVRVLGITALASFLLSALAVIVIGRTITDPLDELSSAADELANVRLPLLVESLRTPGMEAPTFAPLEVKQQNDEMGKLVKALNAVQDSAAQVATEQQSLVRQGLSELVVNLARRNQSLLDRQIEFIDKLESNEEDPDRLEELFGLDHLATRMRRNAESLLVLAGAEPSRRRGGPVAVADILRVAMSEIEDYRHVHLMRIDEAEIGAQAAVDLAHLLSEVMENATQFSPPESPVEVNGLAQSDGCYLITVADHGLGMTDEQIVASNHVLSNPPELGLSLSRSLGFIVIGRLAKRLDVEVELAYTDGGGITALVLVPISIMTGGESPALVAPGEMPAGEMPAAPSAADAIPSEAMPAEAAPASMPSASSISAAADDEPAWVPPTMPDRGNPFATPANAPAAPAPAALQEASGSDALAKLLGVAPPAAAPLTEPTAAFSAPAAPQPMADEVQAAEPAPSFDTPAFDTPAFDTPAFDAPAFDAPAFDAGLSVDAAPVFDPAPSFEPPSTDAPSFDAPSFDAPSLDAAPTFEAPLAEPDIASAPSVDPFAPPAGAPDPFGIPAGLDDAFNPPADLNNSAQDDPFTSPMVGTTDLDGPFGQADFGQAYGEPAATEPDVWQGPNFGAPDTMAEPTAPAPANLEQAMPSGDRFDAGMASLLDPSPGAAIQTSTGLIKRDRSKSQAPTSEGRPIKASARSPEEVRQMLARYRDGRNRPIGDAANPNSSNETGDQS